MNNKLDLETLPSKYYHNGKLTPFFYYRLYTVGKEYFKSIILKLDTSHTYTTEVTKEVIDEEASKKLSGKYADRLVYLEEKWQEYRDSHLDEFIPISATDSLDDFTTSKLEFIPNCNFSLRDAVIGYVICSEKLKEFDKEELPKFTKLISAPEYKEKHAKVREMLREELKIPPAEDLQVKHVVTKVQMKRFSKKTTPDTSDSEVLDILKEDYLEFLCE